MSDKFHERIRRNRLNSLRDRMLDLTAEKPTVDEFKLVLSELEITMVEHMWHDYKYSLQGVSQARVLAPNNVKAFVVDSIVAAHRLMRIHERWYNVGRDLKMDDSGKRRTYAELRKEHKTIMLMAKRAKANLAQLDEVDLWFIQRPIELPEKPRTEWTSFWTDYRLSQRYKWFYVWRDKIEFHGKLTAELALGYLLLWQVETNLGLPHTDQAELNWYPVFDAVMAELPKKKP